MPRGRPFDTGDLGRLKISASLVHRYLKSGWVERIARGVYMFAGDTLQRDGCLAFLAEKLSGFHVGGKTALAWRGMGHNLPAQERLMLWGKRNTKLPAWFADRFAARYTVRDLFSGEVDEAGLQPLPEQAGGPPVSVPERALLEMLSEVGVHQEIGEARNIIEGVRSLRAKVLAKFLAGCRQEKAARLCVLWGEELSLPWAGAARAAVGDRFGKKRWVKRMGDGSTLVLKP
jgi:hypothetical protein